METNLYYELAQEIIQQGKIFYDKVNSYYEISGPVIPWLNALTMLVFGSITWGYIWFLHLAQH